MPEATAGISYKWKPIEPLNSVGSSYNFSEIDSLQRQWLSIRGRREESNPHAYNAFLERLDRSGAIETGIIEGLYTLDRGVTETLVQRGFNAELIDRSATNKDPEELVRVLEDHQQAAEGVYHYIREGRPLSKTLIRSLHVTLTQHQPTYTAYDQFGNRFETSLDRGGFKTLPNNPTRPDGRIHEYCPPVQVDSEIDNLVEWHARHRSEGYHPLLVSAWLHHAFTQIHPFQDGNGRVARALLTWHLVREGYLSIVVSRDDRPFYIEALEAADRGNLETFVDLLVQLEKWTILDAIDETEPVAAEASVQHAIDRLVDQIRGHNLERQGQMRSVNDVASVLRTVASQKLETWANQISQRLNDAGFAVEREIRLGGPGQREHWYRAETDKVAREAQYQANLNESIFFAELTLRPEIRESVPRFVFVISLHHVGRQLTGVMAAAAFAEFGNYVGRDIEDPQEWGELYFMDERILPFTFTWDDDVATVSPRFEAWADQRLSFALELWSERIPQ